jgi:hypothetical protein
MFWTSFEWAKKVGSNAKTLPAEPTCRESSKVCAPMFAPTSRDIAGSNQSSDGHGGRSLVEPEKEAKIDAFLEVETPRNSIPAPDRSSNQRLSGQLGRFLRAPLQS